MSHKINKELLAENIVGILSAILLILIVASFFIFKKEPNSAILTKNTEIKQTNPKELQPTAEPSNATPPEAAQNQSPKNTQATNKIAVGFAHEKELRRYKAAKLNHENMVYQKILDKEKQAKAEQDKAEKEKQRLVQERQRLAQERQRLAQERQRLKKEKQQAQLAAKQEQQRIAKERKAFEVEKQRQAEIARKAEAEKKRQAEAARKAEAEKKRQAEAARKTEAEKKRQAEIARKAKAEKKRQVEIARKKAEAEKKRIAAELAASIAKIEAEEKKQQAIEHTRLAIGNKINSRWVMPAKIPQELSVKLAIKLSPSGKVLGTPRIINSSGYRVFDNSAIEAIKRASPLPLPNNKTWAKLFTDEDLILNFPD